jgi:exonuclease III
LKMPPPRNEAAPAAAAAVEAATLYLLSLNTNRNFDLAGLAGLHADIHPDIIFLQEVAIPVASLRAVAATLGLQAWASVAGRRTIAVLSCHPLIVTDIEPGYCQQVNFHSVSFFHFHCPAGANNRIQREELFCRCHRLLARFPVPPLLIGDFNCVVDHRDLAIPDNYRHSTALSALLTELHYVDAYRILHPEVRQFSWHRRNAAASRLDRLYLPVLYTDSAFMVRYLPTVSDHHAMYCVLRCPALGLRVAAAAATQQSFYWKLNTAILSDPGFVPSFAMHWQPIAAQLEHFPGGAAAWWEQCAKPAAVAFCRSFSATVRARAAHTRRFFVRALELALDADDWVTAEGCHHRLRALDRAAAAGIAVRSGQPLLEGELPGIFHYAAEGRHGSSPGVTAVADTDGVVHSSPAAVEAVILPYFEALFNGRHRSAADRPEPYDSGQSFRPDIDKIPAFLEGLPTLPEEQADALEVPFTYPELAAAVKGAAAARAPGLDGLPYEFYKTVLAIIGPQLLKVFNQMLQDGSLVASMRSGVVRLIPKVQGVPTAAQFRPITLLGADYKILTKMFVGRLMEVLPTLLQAGQLCSVRGRSIFDGAVSLLSAVEYLHQKQIPGYVISLDFFHARPGRPQCGQHSRICTGICR